MAKLKKHASSNDWFDEVNEKLYDYKKVYSNLLKQINDITRAFKQGTAKWNNEQIEEEVEYLLDTSLTDIDELPKIDVEDLKEEMTQLVKGAAEDWKELREEHN